MSAEIHYLSNKPVPIGQFIKVGSNGYRQLETLHGTGRIQLPRVVIDASQIDKQSDLVSTLRDAGSDIVLDSGIAELSSIGRFDGAAKNVSWANIERPLQPRDFKQIGKDKIVQQIAEFSVAHDVDTVLAPSHLINGIRDNWMSIDFESCKLLRKSLDDAGGQQISIDYPLILPYAILRDPVQRRAMAKELAELPFDNLWLRVSSFGADATPVGVKRYIAAVADFHQLNKPLVADCVGGLSALALTAFGAVAAISHGVAEKERLDTNSWHVRPKGGGGGQSGRLYLPGLDRYLKQHVVEEIMSAKGGRRLLACHDRDCCALGFEDTVKNPKAHFLIQRRKQIEDLERTHQDKRVARYLDYHLRSADRTARQAAKLKISDDSITNALQKSTLRLDRMRGVLEDLDHNMGADSTKSVPLKVRASVLARINQDRR
jgi:hypothetical protein